MEQENKWNDWVIWRGGEMVKVHYRDGDVYEEPAGERYSGDWEHTDHDGDIVDYCTLKQPVEKKPENVFKFKVGDVVTINSDDEVYGYYEEMAEKMQLTNWNRGAFPSTPSKGIVVAASKHTSQDDVIVYGVSVNGKDFLVDEQGLSLAEEDSVTSKTANVSGITIGGAASSEHYINDAMQPIEIMQMTFSYEEMLGFLKGNIIKYSFRAGKKQGESAEKDLNKVKQYKLWLDIVLKGGVINPRTDVI